LLELRNPQAAAPALAAVICTRACNVTSGGS